jgi:hypothetical protein
MDIVLKCGCCLKMWMDIVKNVDRYCFKNVDGYSLKMWMDIVLKCEWTLFKNVDGHC